MPRGKPKFVAKPYNLGVAAGYQAAQLAGINLAQIAKELSCADFKNALSEGAMAGAPHGWTKGGKPRKKPLKHK